MHYHLILTELCNSQCRYCYEKSFKEFDNQLNKRFKFDFSGPQKSAINVKQLKSFIEKDKDAVIIFYGGEPLLEIDKIKEIMDSIDVPYRMQTNGKLLNKLPRKYLNRIGKILVSLDGSGERTDHNRGEGTYDLVMKNIKLIRKNGYDGEIVARMVVSQEFPDVYEQVLSLVSAGFTSIHWQLDAGFYKFDFNKKQFAGFVKDYNKSVSKLIDFWIGKMKEGVVLRLYPFLGIVNDILNNTKTKLRCGAGREGYAIATDGKVVACPIMNCIEDFKAGDLGNNPDNLKKFLVDECGDCVEFDLCGGRCLYWRKAKLWPQEGDEMICSTIRYLIGELRKNIFLIEELIDRGIIEKEDFDYEKYFGPEIIP